jgi:hypothetical protein
MMSRPPHSLSLSRRLHGDDGRRVVPRPAVRTVRAGGVPVAIAVSIAAMAG